MRTTVKDPIVATYAATKDYSIYTVQVLFLDHMEISWFSTHVRSIVCYNFSYVLCKNW